MPFEYGLNEVGRHLQAARALIAKLGWGDYGPLVSGWTETGMVFVFVDGAECSSPVMVVPPLKEGNTK